MLKKFLCLLVVVFTFQVSWAMASAYCMHESGQASQHFGHHQHQHHASGAEEHSPTPKKAAFHADCASCVHGSLAAYGSHAELVMPLPAGYLPAALPAALPAPYLGQPERPQWPVAA